MINRNLNAAAGKILTGYGKMLFLSGPRQAGKTTLAKKLLEGAGQGTYFNWDTINHQKKLIADPYFFEKENRDPGRKFTVVFDEIHKYHNWKNYLKGAYDAYSKDFSFLVTGSGRLDLFKKGGDSLLGRYLPLQLFPLSLGEILGNEPDWNGFKRSLSDMGTDPGSRKIYQPLFEFSGFPEPYTRQDPEFYNMWAQERKQLLVRDDIRSAYAIREISNIEILANLLPGRVGSPLSINSLREDVSAAFDSVKDWLLILEQFYYLFRLKPFTRSIANSLKKEAKAYLYDWVEVPDEAFRFENLTALHLYKAASLWRALGQADTELFYLRDKQKREADFLLTENGKPAIIIECKQAKEELSDNLLMFQRKTGAPLAIQLVHKPGVLKKMRHNRQTQWVISAECFLKLLP